MTKRHLFTIGIKTAVAAMCVCLVLTQALGCGVKKAEAIVTVSLSEKTISLLAGYTQTLSAELKPAGTSAGAASWSSDNPAIASVNNKGTVTAVSAGVCKVTYSIGKKAKAVCDVTVTPSSNWTTVLMYHSIVNTGNKLRIPSPIFGEEMKWLHDNNYTSLTLDQLNDYMVSKKPFPEKSVVITLDDGYDNNYNGAYPYIKQYNLHATIFVISGNIGHPGFLNADQIKEMSDSGYISIQGHTVTHPFLDTLTYDQQYKELSLSKQTLEGITGKTVDFLAYPTGRYNADTITIAKSLGYKMCFLMEGGSGTLQNNPYEFPRAFVDKNLNTLIDAVNGLGY